MGIAKDASLAVAEAAIRGRRFAVLQKVCDAYKLKPGDLAKVLPPDLAAMMRRVAGVKEIDMARLKLHVAEFIESHA